MSEIQAPVSFGELLDIKATRKRWNHLLTLMRQRWSKLCGLRVFELHEFHGLHVHLKTSHAALLKKIEDSKALDKDAEGELTNALVAFKKSFA